jgi:hypothetical protein
MSPVPKTWIPFATDDGVRKTLVRERPGCYAFIGNGLDGRRMCSITHLTISNDDIIPFGVSVDQSGRNRFYNMIETG